MSNATAAMVPNKIHNKKKGKGKKSNHIHAQSWRAYEKVAGRRTLGFLVLLTLLYRNIEGSHLVAILAVRQLQYLPSRRRGVLNAGYVEWGESYLEAQLLFVSNRP